MCLPTHSAGHVIGEGGGASLCGVAPRCDIPRGRACVLNMNPNASAAREDLCQEPTGSIGVG